MYVNKKNIFSNVLRMSAPEVISSNRNWNRAEKRLWGTALLLSGTVVYAARFSFPICVTSIAKDYEWSKTTSGTVLSSFFWGYAMTQIIGGYQADKLGGSTIMIAVGIIWSLMTFWTPQFIQILDFKNYPDFSMTAMILFRVIYGAMQGMHFPAMVNVISSNLSPIDRTLFTSIVFCGGSIGMIFCGLIASFILTNYTWHYVFSFIGAVSIAWLLFFRCYVIEKNRTQVICFNSNVTSNPSTKTNVKVPWLLLFSSHSFWALLIAHFFHANSWFLVFSWIPSFFHEKFPRLHTYYFSSLPYFISVISSIVSGYLGEYLIKKYHSVTIARKIVHCISQSLVIISLFFLDQTSTDWVAVALMCITVAGGSFAHASTLVNSQDLLPECSGSMFGIMNTAGAVPGFIGVYICGYILETTGSWQLAFNYTIFGNLIGLIIFVMLGSGKKLLASGKDFDATEVI